MNAFADDLFVREKAFRETLIHDDDARRLWIVVDAEITTAEQWDFERMEITRADRNLPGKQALRSFGTAFDDKDARVIKFTQRRVSGCGRGLDAGQGLQLLGDLSEKSDSRLAQRVTRYRKVEIQSRHAFRIEARIDRLQLEKAFDEQPCAYQQDQR